jgi:exo-1,4-beta-D-glucosaminidase
VRVITPIRSLSVVAAFGLVASLFSGCGESSKKDKQCSNCAAGGSANAGGSSPSGGSSQTSGGTTGSSGVGGTNITNPDPATDQRTVLRDNWKLASSQQIKAAGSEISGETYDTAGWNSITVPATVLAGLMQNGKYTDIYFGENMKSIPEADFENSWWYRTEFELSAEDVKQNIWLGFDGLNFSADIWLNGEKIRSRADAAGVFRTYRDLVSKTRAGKNVLALEVFPPQEGDLGINWWDWNVTPPDKNLGIWRDVYLRKTGPVALQSVFITSKVPTTSEAQLTFVVHLENVSSANVSANVELDFGSVHVSQKAELAAAEKKVVRFEPAQFPELALKDPALWWPVNMGSPTLHKLAAKVSIDSVKSDERTINFGIREVTASVQNKQVLFKVNGKPVLIRGGGWAPDMLLRSDAARLTAEMSYVRDMGMNTLRLEGKPETEAFYAAADALGIMLMPGWMCCDKWEKWSTWEDKDRVIAAASMRSQAEQLRNHPSVIDFLIASDKATPADIEKLYLDALKSVEWPNPITAAAAAAASPQLGESGMKMTGPYDWVAPSYWYLDTKAGGAFGFNSETGPGPAIPELETLSKMLSPAEQQALWAEPNAEQFHAGTPGMSFAQLSIFNAALAARHGKPSDLKDYVRKAQLMNYEAERAQFEAFSRNKYAKSTGVIHWLLNNAWPSLIWHLYDYSLLPAGAYFGAKKANEPLHIQFSYDDRSVFVINHGNEAHADLKATAAIYNLDGSVLHSENKTISVAPDAVAKATTLPTPAGLSETYFVALELSRGNEVVSRNFYWLSTQVEQIDFAKSNWFHAPTKQFAKFTALNGMPSASVKATREAAAVAGGTQTSVTLENTSDKLAFFVRMTLVNASGEPIVPVLWQDNYVSLAPGEKRTLSATTSTVDPIKVQIEGWNVAPQTL